MKMRKAQYPTQCKDCGSGDVIRVFERHRELEKNYFNDVLCPPCLQSRAQLQNMKEDKLPFHKLLAKIRGEMMKAIHHICASDRLKKYKGVNPYAHVNNLPNYWIEQLQGGK